MVSYKYRERLARRWGSIGEKENMTHTKGPWRIGDAGNTVVGPPCELPPQRIADLSGTKDMHANGRLIAAAPELLAALQEFVIWSNGDFENDQPLKGLSEVFEHGKLAIAKATGKEEK